MWVTVPHHSNQAVTLETHIRDVCGTIEMEEAQDIILCGHSYGGMVITGVADRMADRIKALVYLDAFIPQDGDSLTSLLRQALPAEVWPIFVNGFRDSARADNCWPDAAHPGRGVQHLGREPRLGRPPLPPAGAGHV